MTAVRDGKGEVGAGEDRALRGSCVWASCNLALSVHLLAARDGGHRCQGRARRRAESARGRVLSCRSAPTG